MKHVFSIDIKELKNIPVLAKFIKDARDFQSTTIVNQSTGLPQQRTENVEDSDDQNDFVSSDYI